MVIFHCSRCTQGKRKAVEHQLGARVVKDLTKELQGKWHHVYFANLFTSYSYSVIWKTVGSMGVGQPERIDVIFQRTSRQQNLRTGIIYTLHKQFVVYTMHGILHHKYGAIYSL